VDDNNNNIVYEEADGRMECPGCGQAFPSSWTNENINQHLDNCVTVESGTKRKGNYNSGSEEESDGYDDY